MDENTPAKLSTSALARRLEVPSQQLFATLKDYGWIRKADDGWLLSSKGEFEGGEYIHSQRYGRYIVWPEAILEHPLLHAMEDNQHISATLLGRQRGLSARQVNRLLAEIGWIKHGFQGWELTSLGEQQGGIQLENDSSGTLYVVWPKAVQTDAVLMRQLQQGAAGDSDVLDDLFAKPDSLIAIDGHQHSNTVHWQVCNWLYLAGIAHACQRQLPVAEALVADFYLPAHRVYIECWSEDSKQLAQRLKRKSLYEQLGLTVIDIGVDDVPQLDEVLTRQFRKLGIRVY